MSVLETVTIFVGNCSLLYNLGRASVWEFNPSKNRAQSILLAKGAYPVLCRGVEFLPFGLRICTLLGAWTRCVIRPLSDNHGLFGTVLLFWDLWTILYLACTFYTIFHFLLSAGSFTPPTHPNTSCTVGGHIVRKEKTNYLQINYIGQFLECNYYNQPNVCLIALRANFNSALRERYKRVSR